MSSVFLAGLLLVSGSPHGSGRTPLPLAGRATYYNKGVMETVWVQRAEWGHVPACVDCVGAVAMIDCRDMGRRVWLEGAGQVVGPFMVADCAASRDVERFRKAGVVVEVPQWLAQAWGMRGPLPVRVVDGPASSPIQASGPGHTASRPAWH